MRFGKPDGLHGGGSVLSAGAPLGTARVAVILLHGRGGSAGDMLSLADHLAVSDVAFLAPQAANHTWYPLSFLQPVEANERWLGSALLHLADLVGTLDAQGLPRDRVMILGFSQGGCLALEFAARNPSRYGGVAGLSAGLIGPPGTTWPKRGDLAGTPVLLGCSDRDPHIPLARVRESETALRALGGCIDARIYAGQGHAINADEIAALRQMIGALPRSKS
jgi:predicted esterase